VGANQEEDTKVKGQHTLENMQKILDKFIVKYVLCAKCKYPECAFEIRKTELYAVCNACGTNKKLDTAHKAGKQMMKDIPNFYSANPEFKGKTNKAVNDHMKLQEEQKDQKMKKATKTDEDAKLQAIRRAEDLERDGGEVNVLDAVSMALDAPEIENEIQSMDAFLTEADRTCEELLTYVRHL